MSDDGELCVVFLDVGQGDATIVLPPIGEGDPIVFDCGADGWAVVQQLRTWQFERLEAVIASHLDMDHVGGMLTLLEAYRNHIGAVYFAPDRDISETRDGAKKVKTLADRVITGDPDEWELRAVHRDARAVSKGANWSVHVVAPRASSQLEADRCGRWDDPNRYSAVLRVEMAGKVVLVGGDAPLKTWAELYSKEDGSEIGADVFRVPHHGGALDDGGVPENWSASCLYEKIDPRTAVISVGTNNDHGHPDVEEWVAPLIGRTGCRMLCTQVTGACDEELSRERPNEERLASIERRREALPSQRDGMSHFAEPLWRHYRQVEDSSQAQRRRDLPEMPCVGAISVRIDARGDMFVDPAEDNLSLVARIQGWSRPLCRR